MSEARKRWPQRNRLPWPRRVGRALHRVALRVALRLARRALVALVRLDPLAPAASLQLLGVSRRRSEEAPLPRLTILGESYKSATSYPFWNDFVEQLSGLREQYEGMLLQGKYDDWGRDRTEYIRPAYGLLLEILAIPARVEAARRMAEAEAGFAPAQIDNSDEAP